MAGGRLEERVRNWVRQRMPNRGDRARLAAHLDRQRGWVTRYLNGQVDADLDTTVALASYFAVPVATLLGSAAPPRVTKADVEDRELLALWTTVPARERPIVRRIIELYARTDAAAPSTRATRRPTARSRRRTPPPT